MVSRVTSLQFGRAGEWSRAEKDRSEISRTAKVRLLTFLKGLTAAPVRRPARFAVVEPNETTMPRIAGPLLACALALANTPANAQAGATPATPEDRENALLNGRRTA